MADPFRLAVLKKLTSILGAVSITNGYNMDWEGHYRGRAFYGESDTLPFTSLLESPITADQIAMPVDFTGNDGMWNMILQGFVEDEIANPSDKSHIAMADVKRALALELKTKRGNTPDILQMGAGLGYSNGIESMSIGPGVVRPSDDISATAHFWVILSLKVTENLEDPYDYFGAT